MKKIYFFVSILIVIIIGIVIAYKVPKNISNKSQKVKVITTLFPLYDFAKNIGQDKIEISLLLPPGVEAHTFEPKPSDIAKISESDIFIYTGKFMEPWVSDIIGSLNNKNLVIIDASQGTKKLQSSIQDSSDSSATYDPHIWLDFDNTKIIAESITEALIKKDPSNSKFYQKNLDDYKNSLSALDIQYQNILSKCKTRQIVYGGHYAFGYLADRYNLLYTAAQGLSPDSEPSAQEIMKLIKQIKDNNIQYIFYEELSSPKIAETLAHETKAKLLFLNAAHNISKNDFDINISFIDIMNKNLLNLKVGLECN